MRILHLAEHPADAPAWTTAIGFEHEIVVTTDWEGCVAALKQSGADVVLVDLPCVTAGQPDFFAGIREAAPAIPVLLLVKDSDEDRALGLATEEGCDYVLTSHPKRLGQALRKAVRDNTERRELNDALVRVRAEWEQRMQERTARLEAAMKELEAFSYSVSHDLRAPLRGIDGFARALLEDCGPNLGAEGQRLVHVIRHETRRMTQLIDDLLAFSKAGRQQIDPSAIDMTELARSAFQNIIEALPGPYPALELQALPTANGDRSMLRQVFANLLGNAVKFSTGRPSPQIEVTGWTEAGSNIYRVKDNGVGFNPRYAHKLFNVFQRLHSQEEFEGTGVGLALVQRILQRHGGRVWAESTPQQGASFFFALPSHAQGAASS